MMSCVVKPIILYGSEMWGDAVLKNNFEVNKIIQIYDKFDCQKLNIKYCKFILGVYKNSSNQAVLRVYPIKSLLSLYSYKTYINCYTCM
jgi:hypothetical protein